MPFYPNTTLEQQYWQCDKPIGPNFYFELKAFDEAQRKSQKPLRLVGQHFSWHSVGLYDAVATIEFFEDTPQDVIDGVLEVFAAHDPETIPEKEL